MALPFSNTVDRTLERLRNAFVETARGAREVVGAPLRPDLPDDAAYRFAKALHQSQPALGTRLPQAVETTVANTLAALPRPELLHPGVKALADELAKEMRAAD